MSYSSIRTILFAIAMFLAVGFALTPAPVKAQSTTFAVAKYLCPWTNAPAAPDPVPCLTPSNQINQVIPGQPVFYLVTILGNTNTWNLALTDTYPPGFHVQDERCVVAGSTAPVFPLSQVPIAAGQTIHCTMAGYFTTSTTIGTDASNTVNLTAAGTGGAAGQTGTGTAKVTATVLTTATLPTDLSITKTPDVNSIALGGTVTWTVTISNSATGKPVYLGGFLQVYDRLALLPGSMGLTATLIGTPTCTASAGASCLDPPSIASSLNLWSSWSQLAVWRYGSSSAGFLPPGGSMTLVYKLKIDATTTCASTTTEHGFRNYASFDLLGQAGATVSELTPANNATDPNDDPSSKVVVTHTLPDCPPGAVNPIVTLTKVAQNPNSFTQWPWGSSITYDVTFTNSSGVTLTNLSINDWVFTNYNETAIVATVPANPVCVPACGGAVTNPNPKVIGSGWANMWNSSTIASLPDGATITFPITITYDMNSCEIQSRTNWSITNFVRVNFNTTAGGFWADATEAVAMEEPPLCRFKVEKTFQGGAAPATLLFNTPYHYDVTFTNQSAVPATIYTLADLLRIDVTGYAVSMPLAYGYICNGANVTGYPASSPGYPTLVSGPSVNVQYTTNPVNGTPIIYSSGVPIAFAAGAILTCTVDIMVQRPAPGDPNCMGTGAASLQNAAMLYPSPGYNFSGGPPVASLWAEAPARLPRCFNLTVNKAVNPPAALGTGPPLNYTITVTNNGDPISGLSAPNWLTLTDVFTGTYSPGAASVTVSNPMGSCNPGPDNCNVIAASGNPISLGIENLASGQVIDLTFPLAPPFTTENVRNDVAIQTQGTLTTDWYAREPNTLINFKEVPITTPATPSTGDALLKVCKVAGEGVEVGTPFNFTATPTGTGAPATVTVPAGPGPGGYCQIVGRYAVGTPVVLAERVPPGHEVSAIAVEGAAATLAPVADLPGGRVGLTLGPGVSEATFTNVGHGYVEICKAGDVTGMFHFTIDGRQVDVPAGACSPAIELGAGMHRLVESESSGTVMLGCQIWPADRESSCQPRDRSMTFEVQAGSIATQTIVTVVNGPTQEGDGGQLGGGTAGRH